MLKAELSRFKVKEGKSGKVDEWMAFLNDHMEDTLLTLENEKMFVESIHREVVNGTEFLYWYSVQGEAVQRCTIQKAISISGIWNIGMNVSMMIIKIMIFRQK